MSQRTGFTLLEMLVVLTIVATLALLAVPGYQQPLQSVRYSEAGACLIRIASAIERHHAATASDNEPFSLAHQAPDCVTRLSRQFAFGFMDAEGALQPDAPSRASWLLQAESLTSRAASAGISCGALTFSHTGRRGAIGSKGQVFSSAEAIRRCWH